MKGSKKSEKKKKRRKKLKTKNAITDGCSTVVKCSQIVKCSLHVIWLGQCDVANLSGQTQLFFWNLSLLGWFVCLSIFQFNRKLYLTLNITVTMNLLQAKETSHHLVTQANLVQLLSAKTEKVTLDKISSAKGGLDSNRRFLNLGIAKIGSINRKWHWNIKLEWAHG